jgi:putative transposase
MGVRFYRAHVARLELDQRQIAVLDGQAHTARAVWNLLHEFFTFRQGRFASPAQCDEAIRVARKEIDWLNDLPAQAAQAVVKAYRQAWANFFNPSHPAGRPRFKSRFSSRMAVDVPQGRDLNITRINRRWGAVNIPKLGRVRFRWTKDLPGVTRGRGEGKITGARLVKEANGWHIVVRTQTMRAPQAQHAGSQTAIDRGIAVPLALTTGEKIFHRQEWLTGGEQERLLRLERKAARQKRAAKPGRPTSNRLKRTYDQIARLRAKAKRRAIDWQHLTTAKLTDRFSVIVLEDLKVKNMMASASGTLEQPGRNVAQKRDLNRAIAGQAWGRTAEFLTYKATDKGGKVPIVLAPGTSRECYVCHTIIEGSRETQSRFACKNTACGWIGNADVNAARTQLYRYNSAAGQVVTGRGGPAPLGPVKRRATHGGTTRTPRKGRPRSGHERPPIHGEEHVKRS